jgi:hypothetical protein
VAFYFIGFSLTNKAQGGFIGGGNYLLSADLSDQEILMWLY